MILVKFYSIYSLKCGMLYLFYIKESKELKFYVKYVNYYIYSSEFNILKDKMYFLFDFRFFWLNFHVFLKRKP